MSEPLSEIEQLKLQLDELSLMIATTIKEVGGVRHPSMEDDRLSGAVDELAAMVLDTEAATDAILDAAELLEQMAQGAWDAQGNSLREPMSAITTRIFEACNFQDLSGQRIAKVTTLLRDIDARLSTIIEALGARRFDPVDIPAAPDGDAALLNGPARTGQGLEQDSVDALMH
ncbi:chemotaxis protein CheZ [Arboricoccus pini]|uniref:Chemotaxis protein CheZ n=1 Tax=Arboricoccus pini TaxID=1963835 RepID=A0A212RCT1_9PROT|nr:protein phosphatase CheZ [Arboricoccus pini]SNB70056.1 chemotaxis protein CheZ [Arboricoccus pini]